MNELELLYSAFENFKNKRIFEGNLTVNCFNSEKQLLNCTGNFSKDLETGILKIKYDGNINTEDIKCIHKIDNETNLKSICSKYQKHNSEKIGSFDFLENFIDLSVLLSLLNSLEINTNEDNSTTLTIDLKEIATDLKEDDFDCFDSEANSHLVTISKIVLSDIASEKYDSIVLTGFISANKEIEQISIKGLGKQTLDVNLSLK
ncbi:MAG: hypothetical protein ACRDD2_00735 [Sarcina sp.]